MSTSDQDRIDTAIDHTARRMVAVQHDPDLVMRIVSALPERSSRLSWFIPQFAALSALALIAVVWSMRERPSPALLPSSEIAAVAAFPAVALAREPGTREPGTLRTKPPEPSEPPEPPEPLDFDFDRSLPALVVAEADDLNVIEPRALPAVEALALAPIEIGELPLTAVTSSPNKF